MDDMYFEVANLRKFLVPVFVYQTCIVCLAACLLRTPGVRRKCMTRLVIETFGIRLL